MKIRMKFNRRMTAGEVRAFEERKAAKERGDAVEKRTVRRREYDQPEETARWGRDRDLDEEYGRGEKTGRREGIGRGEKSDRREGIGRGEKTGRREGIGRSEKTGQKEGAGRFGAGTGKVKEMWNPGHMLSKKRKSEPEYDDFYYAKEGHKNIRWDEADSDQGNRKKTNRDEISRKKAGRDEMSRKKPGSDKANRKESGRKESGWKDTIRREAGRKESGWKENDRKETGWKENDRRETGWKENDRKETGWKENGWSGQGRDEAGQERAGYEKARWNKTGYGTFETEESGRGDMSHADAEYADMKHSNEQMQEGMNADNEPDASLPKIEGRNAVLEAFRAGKTIDKLFVLEGCKDGPVQTIIREAKKHDTIINFVDKERLIRMSGTKKHQGVIAVTAAYEYASVDDILQKAEEAGEQPFLILLDNIEDPHNLGAIIRTANLAGAHGVIIPKRRAVGLTGAVAKASAGAINYTPVAKVTNLNQTIKELKERGIWFVCADMEGEQMYRQNLTGPIGLVIGAEGAGVSRLVKENCDFSASIPMKGEIGSLNASTAAAVLSYEIVRQREFSNK